MQYIKLPLDQAQAILNCLAARPYVETLWEGRVSLPELLRTSQVHDDNPPVASQPTPPVLPVEIAEEEVIL